MSFTAKFLTISALLFGVNNSIACNPGEHHYVHFADSSDELSGAEAGKLGSWIVSLKKYPNHQIFLLVGYVKPAEKSEILAKRRAKWVKDFLVQMGEDSDGVVYGGTTVYSAEKVGNSGASPSALAIEFVPGCPNPCCTGPQEVQELARP
ncbi:hypothetical protein ACU4GI_24410 [Cupriavidus basilensis]|uniref:hypothetical protein n=1 Tax=Cupriavidus basilensis TaxID=68895 RepID=UPI0023E765F7|nr:hypothetical protein [Cupriavidus basilensis]MDF3887593.1 hypothetical protein [Cupriavidus basilensis]